MSQNLDYGSDIVVEILQRLGIQFATLNPGASFRGIHESLVARDNVVPITCLFEGTSISIAHGYAKAAGRPMAAVVHNLVGLQHASMGLFNAYSDGVPMLVVGGSGPADRTRRRPWIDWVHTPSTQGLTIRPFVKYEAQPVSLSELPGTFARAYRMAMSSVPGPSYVAVDATFQETRVSDTPSLEIVEPASPTRLAAPPEDLEAIAGALADAQSPIILADNTGKSLRAYEALIEIAEHLAIPVVDLAGRHSFPNNHWADATFDRTSLLPKADVVLCLDPRDTRWATTTIDQKSRGWNDLLSPEARLFVMSLNELRNTSFIEVEPVVRAELNVTADTATALPALAELVMNLNPGPKDRRARLAASSQSRHRQMADYEKRTDVLTEGHGVAAVYEAISSGPWQLAFAGFRNWVRRTWKLEQWNAHLGGSGGAGLGYGPGAAVGAALAHKDDDTLVVTIQPDGDLLYDTTALWTSAHHRLPLLMVVIDNGTYGADRIHQTRMAQYREGRSSSRAHIGVDFDDPAIDVAALARAQGVQAWKVDTPEHLPRLSEAARYVQEEGLPAVVTLKTPKPEVSGLG